MKRAFERVFVLSAVLLGCAALSAPDAANAQQSEGEKLFMQVCVACHTINGGKLIGPDLANVHKRRPQEWIMRFIKSSQTVVKSGDEYAVQLFEQYKIPMPDNNFTDSQILSIIEYVAANSLDDGSTAETAAAEPEKPATEEDILEGQALFNGRSGLENGGATCNSCHDVKNDDLLAGGALAKDLTDAYSRLTGVGVKAILKNPPFPAMNQAFKGKPLTDEEVHNLTAFLQHVDAVSESQTGRNYVRAMLFPGLGGVLVLIGLFFGIWRGSKKRSVNHTIYERQVKATWEVTNNSGRIG